jgi:glycosyltransferase involved in cell wall biosynthesis
MTQADQASRPLVSILIPSFNQGRYLTDALDSTLAQEYRPLEVIVMDGGSTDDTVSILERYARRWPELRWWSEPDRGVVDAVNKALARATGVYAGIQSSDDIYLPGAIAGAIDRLEAEPRLGLVYGDGSIMDAEGETVLWDSHYPPFSMEASLLGTTVILQSSAFFRLDLARELGGWRESCFVADLDLWLRMSFVTEVEKVNQRFSVWRSHPGQRNDKTREIWTSYWRMIDECEGLRGASSQLRRAAHAGRRLFTRHYNPTTSHWYVRYQLWRAILGYPRAFTGLPDKAFLVPGLQKVLRGTGRLGLVDYPPAQSTESLDLRWWPSTDAA